MGETVQMGRRDFLRSIAATSAAVASPAPASTLVPTADREVLQGEVVAADFAPAPEIGGKKVYVSLDPISYLMLRTKKAARVFV
jgi:hypothetical protein